MTENLHEILESYVNNNRVAIARISKGWGAVAIGIGVIAKEFIPVLAGGALLGYGFFTEHMEYYKAYCSAQLDFIKNGKFRRLENKVQQEGQDGDNKS